MGMQEKIRLLSKWKKYYLKMSERAERQIKKLKQGVSKPFYSNK